MGLNPVAIPTPLLFLDDVASLGQVRNNAESRSFGHPQSGRDVAKPDPGIVGDTDKGTGMIREKAPLGHRASIGTYAVHC